MRKVSVLFIASLIVLGMSSYAQTDGGVSIGKGNNPANTKSILELVSKTKGLLIPRMTDTERNAIFSGTDLTAKGLMVFDSSLNVFYFWDGMAWKPVDSGNMQTVAGTPTTPGVTGDLALDTQNSLLYIYSGGKWVRVSGNNTILEPKLEGRILQLGSQDGKAVSVSMDDLLKTIPASDVKVTPNATMGLSANNVQDALMELQGEIKTASSGGMNSVVHDGSLAGNGTSGLELKVAPGGIANSHLADGAVTASKILGGGRDKVLTTNVYGTTEWVDKSAVSEIGGISAVIHDKTLTGIGTSPLPLGLAINSVTTNEIVNETIKAEDLHRMDAGDGYFLQYKLGGGWAARAVYYNSTITGIGTDVSPLGLADNAVTAAKIADGAITTAKIADKAVTGANLSPMGATSGQVLQWDGATWKPGTSYSGTGGGASINVGPTLTGNGTTLPLGLADGAVTSTKVAPGAIGASNLSPMGATAPGQVLQWDGLTWAATTPLVTAADKAKLDQITGTNTGDETKGTILTKLGATELTGSNTGDQTLDLTGNRLTISGMGGNYVDLSAIGGSDITRISAGTGLTGGGTTGDVTLGLTPVASNSILGNNTGGVAAPTPLTGGQVKTMLALTKADIGLGNVDNTSDLAKPISTATQTALAGKVDENAAIIGGTATKITYDSKGLVTGGANPTTLAGYGITDAASSTHAHAAGDLTDVTITSETINDILQWNGSAWINKKPANLGLTGTDVGLGLVKNVDQTNAANLISGTIDPARFGTATIPISSLITTGTADGTTFLRGDGTWGTPTGGTGSATNLSATTTATLMTINSSTGTSTATIPIGSTTSAGLITADDKIKLNGISGSNTGDLTLSGSGQSYLTLSGQTLTAGAVDLSGTHATGTLAAARFPALTGDVTMTAGTLTTTLSNVGTAGTYRSVTTDAKGRVIAGSNPTKLEEYGIIGTADGNVLQWDNTSSKWLNTAPSALGLTKNDIGLGNVQNVDQTNAGNLTSGTISAARFPALTGDVTTSTGTLTTTLNSVGTAGTYRSVTTDAKGRVISGTNPTTLSGYGITDAAASIHTHAVGDLSDVTIASKTINDLLQWNGTAWVNKTVSAAIPVATASTAGLMSGADKAALDSKIAAVSHNASLIGNGSPTDVLGINTNAIGTSNMKGLASAALIPGTSGNVLQSNGDGTFSWLDISSGIAADPSNLALPTGQFYIGDGSSKASAIAKNAIPLSGFGAAEADISLGTKKITNLATPTLAADAATKGYADGLIMGAITPTSVAATGTVTGSNLSGTNTGDQDLTPYALKTTILERTNTVAFTPTGDYQPATKKYVDDHTSALASIGTLTILGNNTGATAAPAALSTIQVKTMLGLDIVENTKLSTWTGSPNLTTLGTITSGTWNGTTIPVTHGGTGATTASGAINNLLPAKAGAGKVLATNATNDGVEWKDAGSTNIPIATAATLGGIRVGSNLSVDTEGILSATVSPLHNHSLDELSNVNISSKVTGDLLQWDAASLKWVNKTVIAAIPAATSTMSGLFTAAEKTKLAGIAESANNYTLPKATNSSLGGVIIGANLTIDGTGVLSAVGGGTGTVTDVSVLPVNGITGSVSNSSTTPEISLTLGAITPSSVATGAITATTITATGDISTSGNLTGNVAVGNLTGILPVAKGGTGVSDLTSLKTNMGLNNVDNTSDELKPISKATQIALDDKVNSDLIGIANGIVPLDHTGKIELDYLPASITGDVSFKGAYNAFANDPALPVATASAGNYYITSVAGTTPGGLVLSVGDWVMSNGTIWSKITRGSDVASFKGRTGAVVPASGDYTTTLVPEGTNLYFTDARVDANATVIGKENSINKKTDVTLGSNSDVFFPTQKAVKTYVDSKVPGFTTADANKVLTLNSGGTAAIWASAGTGSITLAGDVAGPGTSNAIVTGAVTSAKIADGTIIAGDIANQTITATKLNGITGNGTSGQSLTSNGSGGFTWTGSSVTDLSYTTGASSGIVVSSSGNDATLPAATPSNAGLMTSTDKTKLNKIADLTGVADANKVLTANAAGTDATWVTPAAGGGGSSITGYHPSDNVNFYCRATGPGITASYTSTNIITITIPSGVTLEYLKITTSYATIGSQAMLVVNILNQGLKFNTGVANAVYPQMLLIDRVQISPISEVLYTPGTTKFPVNVTDYTNGNYKVQIGVSLTGTNGFHLVFQY